MAGSYIGTPHGGNDFTGESGHDVQRKMRAQADANIRRASNGGQNVVLSADGRRVLSLPRGAAVVTREDGSRYVRMRRTVGRGAGSGRVVKPGSGNSVSTSGPGARVAGPAQVPTKGPGAAVVRTPGGWSVTGPGAEAVGIGPSDKGLAPSVYGSPGLGIITGGGAFSPGGFSLPDDPIFLGPTPQVTAGKDGEQRTSYMLWGINVQPSPGNSDAEVVEKRIGDDTFMMELYSANVVASDLLNTVMLHRNPIAEAAGPLGPYIRGDADRWTVTKQLTFGARDAGEHLEDIRQKAGSRMSGPGL